MLVTSSPLNEGDGDGTMLCTTFTPLVPMGDENEAVDIVVLGLYCCQSMYDDESNEMLRY